MAKIHNSNRVWEVSSLLKLELLLYIVVLWTCQLPKWLYLIIEYSLWHSQFRLYPFSETFILTTVVFRLVILEFTTKFSGQRQNTTRFFTRISQEYTLAYFLIQSLLHSDASWAESLHIYAPFAHLSIKLSTKAYCLQSKSIILPSTEVQRLRTTQQWIHFQTSISCFCFFSTALIKYPYKCNFTNKGLILALNSRLCTIVKQKPWQQELEEAAHIVSTVKILRLKASSCLVRFLLSIKHSTQWDAAAYFGSRSSKLYWLGNLDNPS